MRIWREWKSRSERQIEQSCYTSVTPDQLQTHVDSGLDLILHKPEQRQLIRITGRCLHTIPVEAKKLNRPQIYSHPDLKRNRIRLDRTNGTRH